MQPLPSGLPCPLCLGGDDRRGAKADTRALARACSLSRAAAVAAGEALFSTPAALEALVGGAVGAGGSIEPRRPVGHGAHLVVRGVRRVHLPVPVNLVLVGFGGDGREDVRLGNEEIEQWLEALDTDRPHMLVGGGHGAATRAGVVHYNFSVHAVTLGSRAAGVLERTIAAAARPDDPRAPPAAAGQAYQVDRGALTHALDSLVDELHLDSAAFTMFVANPHSHRGMPHYGYRAGASPAEVEALLTEGALARARAELGPRAAKVDARGLAGAGGAPPRAAAPPSFYNAHLKWRSSDRRSQRSLEFEASNWAAARETEVTRLERARLHAEAEGDPDPVAHVGELADAVLAGKHGEPAAAGLARALADRARDAGGEAIERGAPADGECLSDTVLGESRRWLWVDLTAGPFSWGPMATQRAAGLRTKGSLPDVASIMRPMGAAEAEGGGAAMAATADMERELDKMTQTRFERIEDDDAHDLELLAAELDVYEQFAQRHCGGWSGAPPLCAQLSKRVEAMEAEFAALQDELARTPGSSRLRRLTNPQRFEKLRELDVFGARRHEAHAMHGKATLLSRVGATVSHALRHVVAPPTSAAFPDLGYYEQAHVHIYLIEQPGLPKAARSSAEREVLVAQREIESLALEGQTLQVTLHRLSIGEDPVLAVAYSTALRSAMVAPPGGVEDGYEAAAIPRHYLDTAALRGQLAAIDEATRAAEGEGGGRGASGRGAAAVRRTEVPVFLFALDTEHPVFVDNTDQTARALPEMVIAVASAAGLAPTGLACGAQRLARDPARPAKAIVATVVERLAGILPLHASAPVLNNDGESSSGAEEDWLWAAAGGALGALSPSAALGAPARDAARRAALVHELEAAAGAANDALAALEGARPTRAATAPAALVRAYRDVLVGIDAVASKAGELDFVAAAAAVGTMREAAARLRAEAEAFSAEESPAQCTRRRRLRLGWPLALGLASGGVALTTLALMRPKAHKVHIS